MADSLQENDRLRVDLAPVTVAGACLFRYGFRLRMADRVGVEQVVGAFEEANTLRRDGERTCGRPGVNGAREGVLNC